MAHEFGHALLLPHGDGIDNNNNRVWDEWCDPSERDSTSNPINGGPNTTGYSLMGNGTVGRRSNTLSDNQIGVARDAASVISTRKIGIKPTL